MPDTSSNTPDILVDASGQPRFGRFADTVDRINGRATALRTPLGKPASTMARHFRYKQFQYFGIISDELLVGCALADTAWLGLAFFYIYETGTGALHEFTWRSPLARSLHMSESPTRGESRFQRAGVDIRMGYDSRDNRREKSLSVESADISLQASMYENSLFQPMSLCTRTGINGWTYANKVAGVSVEGTLRWRDREISLADLNACGHHDFSAGYMRRETFWNWACLSGQADGHLIGLNLSCGVNETGETENCLWLDGELVKVGGVSFHYQQDDLDAPWRILSNDGQVNLTFIPDGKHQEKLNLGLFASNFNQLFGRFQGSLRIGEGINLSLENHYGFVEEQFARW